MEAFEALWRPLEALEAFGGLWRPLEAFGGLWRPLEAFGGLWRPLEAFGGLWRPLEAFGGLWRPLEAFGGLWRPLEARLRRAQWIKNGVIYRIWALIRWWYLEVKVIWVLPRGPIRTQVSVPKTFCESGVLSFVRTAFVVLMSFGPEV